MRRLDRLDRLDIVAAERHGVRARTGLTPVDTERSVWCVAVDVRVGGARAVGLALAVGRDARWPLVAWRTPLRLTGLPWLLDRLYEFVAAIRHRLPGDTPWCIAHPAECEPREADGVPSEAD